MARITPSKLTLLRIGNKLYQHCFPLYLPLYCTYKRFTEGDHITLIRSVVKPGMRVVDIGSNIGFYTRMIGELVGPEGQVTAFEPEPGNFRRLQQRLSGLQQVALHHAAVSRESGTITMYASEDLNVDNRTYDCGDGRRQVEVACHALDDYFDPGTQIDFLKMDIQGHEFAAFQGMQRLLRESSKLTMIFEFFPHWMTFQQTPWQEMFHLLHELGFSCTLVDDGKQQPYREEAVPQDENWYCDVIATKG